MEENREILFAKTLENLKKLAKIQGNRLEKEQVEEAFCSLQLSGEQLALVYDYLNRHRIGIGQSMEPEQFLSEEETDYLETYRSELQGLGSCSDGEKEAYTLSAMAGDPSAQKELIRIYLPNVLDIARLYAGQGVLLDDLIGEGNVALTMGVTMLGCLEHASEAEGMLVKMIMDAMEEYVAENAEAKARDERIIKKVEKVAEQARELAGELQRKVTVEELAGEGNLSEKTIRDALRLSGSAIEDIEGTVEWNG